MYLAGRSLLVALNPRAATQRKAEGEGEQRRCWGEGRGRGGAAHARIHTLTGRPGVRITRRSRLYQASKQVS